MTILNGFVKASQEVADSTSAYFITRDPQKLGEAIETLQGQIAAYHAEMAEPTLQETKVSLTKLSAEGLVKLVEADNAVTLANRDYLADGNIEQGKFIRVLATDQEEGSAYLMKVTLVNDESLVLAPVVVQ